jgi:hypothetical protein
MLSPRTIATSANSSAGMAAMSHDFASRCLAAGDVAGAIHWQGSARTWSRRAMAMRVRLDTGMSRVEAEAHIAAN